jgi:hypothetical protein
MRETYTMRDDTKHSGQNLGTGIPDPRAYADALAKKNRRMIILKSIAGAALFITPGIGGGMIAGFCVKRGIISERTFTIAVIIIGAIVFSFFIYCFYRYIKAIMEEDDNQ